MRLRRVAVVFGGAGDSQPGFDPGVDEAGLVDAERGAVERDLLRGVREERAEGDGDDRVGVVVGEAAVGDLLAAATAPRSGGRGRRPLRARGRGGRRVTRRRVAARSSAASGGRAPGAPRGRAASARCAGRGRAGPVRAAHRCRSSSSACSSISAFDLGAGPSGHACHLLAARIDLTQVSATLAAADSERSGGSWSWVTPSSLPRRVPRSGPPARARCST